MNILLIAQCDKRALIETRRILDQFAERRGHRTWQTPITQQGLDTLRQLLKKTARRNTAVACHWIRARDHSELLWIVGDASRFNAQGAVPTNRTERDILRSRDENDWHTGEAIRLLAAIAALFHDFGKATALFQRKLKHNERIADPYRHEWISLRLFQAFIGDDDDRGWLARLASGSEKADKLWVKRLHRDGHDPVSNAPRMDQMPPLARMVGWLIVTHHRLPTPPPALGQSVKRQLRERLLEVIDADWCGARASNEHKDPKAPWKFGAGHLPDTSGKWRAKASRLAGQVLASPGLLSTDWLQNPFVAHLARLVLMLADHHYSADSAHSWLGDPNYLVYANTDAGGALKQRLDEHLIGVERNAHRIARSLPQLERQLPRIARHKGFKRRAGQDRFRWQDRAFDKASSLQRRSGEQGFFGINIASTGCGKTLANARILYALADPQRGARFSIALGLRTLTLQTGQVYRERLGLSDDDLAVLVGGSAVRQLFEHHQAQQDGQTAPGSESADSLLPDNTYVHYEGSLEAGPLGEWLEGSRGPRSGNVRKLLNAPVLVCTIDHLMPACEGIRGGQQIAPMLRLMTSDLVLDEPDDFGLEDLPALTRLVHMAGMLGSRLLLSSATLPPALVQGLFAAYLAGRGIYQRNRGIARPANVCCAWFDEHDSVVSDHADEASFAAEHAVFVSQRVRNLAKQAETEVRRRAVIVPVAIPPGKPAIVRPAFAQMLQPHLLALHSRHHSTDPGTRKRVSFGLVRMANIDPLIDVARALFQQGSPAGSRIHLCVYHAHHPLLMRSAIEQRLDRLLKRDDRQAPFNDPELRRVLDRSREDDHIFVVLASPAAEVGRDHDYDWAIVEPSSMRSIIQLAGRVRRHRSGNCESPNILLLETNRKALEAGGSSIDRPSTPAFLRPGFEDPLNPAFRLASHRLHDLLRPEESDAIDATSRITARPDLHPHNSLVDLEHYRLSALLLGQHGDTREKNVRHWWQSQSHLSGIEQYDTPFRNDPRGRETFVLLPDEDADTPLFFRIEKDGRHTPLSNSFFRPLPIEMGRGISAWGSTDYLDELNSLAEALDMPLKDCALRFGYVDLPRDNKSGWRYDPVLGFRRDGD